jgi:hypothetical protein
VWARSDKPFAFRIYREVKTFKRSGAENRQIALFSKHDFVNGKELAEADDCESDAACYLLTVRHNKR